MSTPSLIARQTANRIQAIYCHWDGLPDSQVPILAKHYATDEAVDGLIGLGDLSVLGPELGRKHDFAGHGSNPKAVRWCLAYRRDHQERRAVRRYRNEAGLLAGARQIGAAYVYLLRGGRWLYRHASKDKVWRKVNA